MYIIDYLIKNISNLLIQRSHKWQLESQLHNLKLWDLEINEKEHITINGTDTIDLIKKFGSPLLVVNQKTLQMHSKEIKNAMVSAPPGSKVLYSYKTNCIPGILNEIHKLGIGAEVISPYELWLAEKLNVSGDLVVYNGVNKTEESIIRAINMNILSINIDHKEEIDRIYHVAQNLNKKAHVGIRLGLVSKSQFGIDIESGEAMDVCKQIAARSDYLDFNSIHFNITSNAKSASSHIYYAQKALDFMAGIRTELGTNISYLDIGGGFGVPTTKNMTNMEYGLYRTFGTLPKPPFPAEFQPIDLFITEIVTSIREYCQELNLNMPKILIEPGRFITSRSELLLTSVLTIKEKNDGTSFVITEAGRLSVTFPAEFEYHEMFVANRPFVPMDTSYQVMGRVCTSADWMFKNRYLPELQQGDILAVMDAGAYFSSNASNFAFPRPAIILVSEGESKIIRDEESFDYLIAMDKI